MAASGPAKTVLVTGAGIGLVSAAIGGAFTYAVFPRRAEPTPFPTPYRKVAAANAAAQKAKDAAPTPPTPTPVPTPSSSSSSSASPLPPAFTRFGGIFPRDPETLKIREGYVASYDRTLRQPRWVLEILTPADLTSGGKAAGVTRARSRFGEDESVPAPFRARLEDYRGSGYDRGHLAPAGDHTANQARMDGTFALSNISPQVGAGFNRDYWCRLEMLLRGMAQSPDFAQVRVVTGPLWLPARDPATGKRYVRHEVIGKGPHGGVAVPTHFFKAVLVTQAGDGDGTDGDGDGAAGGGGGGNGGANSGSSSCRSAGRVTREVDGCRWTRDRVGAVPRLADADDDDAADDAGDDDATPMCPGGLWCGGARRGVQPAPL